MSRRQSAIALDRARLYPARACRWRYSGPACPEGDPGLEAPVHAATSAVQDQPAPSVNRSAWFLLALLTAINLVNYIDRQIVATVGTAIKSDLDLNDEQ